MTCHVTQPLLGLAPSQVISRSRGPTARMKPQVSLVRDTGIEPVTSSVSGKRSPAELIAPGNQKLGGGDGNRTRVHGFAGRCLTTRPLHRWGPRHLHLRADDGIRTRDPHLGKVMRYQLRYIRAPRTTSSPGAKHDDSPRERAHTNFLVRAVSRLSRRPVTRCGRYCRGRRVLVFDVVRRLGAGPVAQWESVRFTRGRSLVRSQPGPPITAGESAPPGRRPPV